MKAALVLFFLVLFSATALGNLAGYALYYTDPQCQTTPVLVTPRTTTVMTLNTANGTSCAANVVCAVNTADPDCVSLSGTQQVSTAIDGNNVTLTVNGVPSPRPLGACVPSLTYSHCYLRFIEPPPTECLNSGAVFSVPHVLALVVLACMLLLQ
jgi:hypothetical protein